MRSRPQRCVFWAAFLCLHGWVSIGRPGTARAYEDQLSLGVGVGYTYATRPEGSRHGASVALEVSRGVSPTWSVRGFGGFGLHPAAPKLSRLSVGAEMVYLVDVLALVPYVGMGVDALASFTDGPARLAFGAHPVAGLDWLIDRAFLVGLCVRPIFVLSEFDTQPLQLTASLSFAALFDL